ncbi:MAG: hypothetical protein ACOCRK_02205 [bacterium]
MRTNVYTFLSTDTLLKLDKLKYKYTALEEGVEYIKKQINRCGFRFVAANMGRLTFLELYKDGKSTHIRVDIDIKEQIIDFSQEFHVDMKYIIMYAILQYFIEKEAEELNDIN